MTRIGDVFKSGKAPDENLTARAIIVSMAQQLGVGAYGSQLCPDCEGGTTKERSLSLDVAVSGVIKFYCHRASCGFQGSAYTTPCMAPHREGAIPAANHLNPLTVDLHPLSDKERKWLKERFGVYGAHAQAIRRTSARYAIPIQGPYGKVRGWITRRPWDGSPADTPANRNDPQWSYKVLTYLEADEPCLSWYDPYGSIEEEDRGVYIVEDPISAIRLAEYFSDKWPGHNASVCALMGTGFNAEKVGEIQRVACTHPVHIALDKDATGHAFAMARKWHGAFYACRVIVLGKDIKDSTDEEIAALPL